jgi:hypothetical protein
MGELTIDRNNLVKHLIEIESNPTMGSLVRAAMFVFCPHQPKMIKGDKMSIVWL